LLVGKTGAKTKFEEDIMQKIKGSSKIMQWITIGIYLLLTVSGLILFKFGASQGIAVSFKNGSFLLQLNWISIMGIFCYGCSFLLYLGLVSNMKLSYIYPITTGIIYILILVASICIFRETINYIQIVGSAFILLGVILMNIKK
jgi:small multidrug resistance pump